MSAVLQVLKIATNFDHLLHPLAKDKGLDETALWKRAACVALFVLVASKSKSGSAAVAALYLCAAFRKYQKSLEEIAREGCRAAVVADQATKNVLGGAVVNPFSSGTAPERELMLAVGGNPSPAAVSNLSLLLNLHSSLSALQAATPSAPSPPPVDPYSTLAAPTGKQKEAIRGTLKILAETSYAFLVFKKGDLDKKGDVTWGLNPLKNIEFILTDRELKELFKQVRKNQVWGAPLGYLERISKAFNEVANSGKLDSYLPGFYKAVSVEPQHFPRLEGLVEDRNWGQWLDILMGRAE